MRQASWDDVPVDPVYPHVLYVQGMWGAACTVAALVERRLSGAGQLLTVDGFNAALITGAATYVLDPDNAVAEPPTGPGGANPCYTCYKAADGSWLFLGALLPKFQERALDVLGLAQIRTDPRIHGQLALLLRPDNRGWVRDAMAERFLLRPRTEWLAALEAADCPAGPLLDRDDWLDHPQLRATGVRIELDDSALGSVVMPGLPLDLIETPDAIRAPAPAQPSRADDGDPQQSRPPGSAGPLPTDGCRTGPLAGVRVLDLGTVLAGPLAGSLLAGLGADVIKVEPPTGDSFRVLGFSYNRGMRSVAVDLRSEDGRAAFFRLVETADMVIDNYRGGVLRRLRIDHDTLRQVNPAVSSYSITGFGESGPLADKPGFDPILQAMSGMMYAQGGADDPVFLTTAINDVAGAVAGALATCLTLFVRQRTGRGQRASSSLARLSAFMQSGELVQYDGRPSARVGGRDYPGPGALDRYYRTREGWLRLQAATSDVPALHAAGLLSADVDEPWDEQELFEQLRRSFADIDAANAVDLLTAAGVPAAVARRPLDLVADGRLMATELFQEHPLGNGSRCFVPGRWVRFGRTQHDGILIAPGLGQHTREVLGECGLDDASVDELVNRGVVVEGGALRLDSVVGYR